MDNDAQFDPATIRMAYFALLLSGRKGENLELAVAQGNAKAGTSHSRALVALHNWPFGTNRGND